MRDTKRDILTFWFEDSEERQWFQKNPVYDELIRTHFLDTYDLATRGLYDGWQDDADGALALVILMDQFPRNMFRDTPKAFASDPLALKIAKKSVDLKLDQQLKSRERKFLYLPFEHSEAMSDQKESLRLFEILRDEDGDDLSYDYALRHYEIIKRFGRFPHRNAVLERPSTEEEIEFLKQPNSGF